MNSFVFQLEVANHASGISQIEDRGIRIWRNNCTKLFYSALISKSFLMIANARFTPRGIYHSSRHRYQYQFDATYLSAH